MLNAPVVQYEFSNLRLCGCLPASVMYSTTIYDELKNPFICTNQKYSYDYISNLMSVKPHKNGMYILYIYFFSSNHLPIIQDGL